MLEAFHGTKREDADSISKHGFSEDRLPNWTGDLGRGVYGFIDAADPWLVNAKHAAAEFPKLKYHQTKIDSKVIKFTLNIPEDDICDLNDPTLRKNFMKNKANLEANIHLNFATQFSDKGASARDNEDGFIIEAMIRSRRWPSWKAIILDTYTPFYARTSNFPNTREICVKDFNEIRQIEMC